MRSPSLWVNGPKGTTNLTQFEVGRSNHIWIDVLKFKAGTSKAFEAILPLFQRLPRRAVSPRVTLVQESLDGDLEALLLGLPGLDVSDGRHRPLPGFGRSPLSFRQ
jgi:hypothetical protein